MNIIKKTERFSFDKLKTDATSADKVVRKNIFIEYYERFEEFPSYLFDNQDRMDPKLFETMQDLTNDPDTSEAMHKGIAALMERLPSPAPLS